MVYDYSTFTSHARRLAAKFHFVDLFTIGESVMEKRLYCLKMGVGQKKVFMTAAEKGTEYLSSQLLMAFMEHYAHSFYQGIPLFDTDSTRLFGSVSIYALPMINPDGVDIALHGLDITNPYHRRLISTIGIHSFSRVWQGNANGVDLSHDFSSGEIISHHGNEPETQAIAEFLRNEHFDSLIQIKNPNRNPYYDYDRPPYPCGVSGWLESEFVASGTQVEIDRTDFSPEEFDNIYHDFARKMLKKLKELV